MRNYLVSFFFLIISCSLNAQFGISFNYNLTNTPFWDDRASAALRTDTEVFSNSMELGVDYWFRLKNKRVEFLPQIAIGRYSNTVPASTIVDNYNMNTLQLNLNTNIYFLDFVGDCDCPTFSKQGGFLSKGLFLQIAPGVGFANKTLGFIAEQKADISHNNIVYKVGAGLGFDIGINDLFTITPIVSFDWYPNIDWESFDLLHYDAEVGAPSKNQTTMTHIQAGVRIGFRPDYK